MPSDDIFESFWQSFPVKERLKARRAFERSVRAAIFGRKLPLRGLARVYAAEVGQDAVDEALGTMATGMPKWFQSTSQKNRTVKAPRMKTAGKAAAAANSPMGSVPSGATTPKPKTPSWLASTGGKLIPKSSKSRLGILGGFRDTGNTSALAHGGFGKGPFSGSVLEKSSLGMGSGRVRGMAELIKNPATRLRMSLPIFVADMAMRAVKNWGEDAGVSAVDSMETAQRKMLSTPYATLAPVASTVLELGSWATRIIGGAALGISMIFGNDKGPAQFAKLSAYLDDTVNWAGAGFRTISPYAAMRQTEARGGAAILWDMQNEAEADMRMKLSGMLDDFVDRSGDLFYWRGARTSKEVKSALKNTPEVRRAMDRMGRMERIRIDTEVGGAEGAKEIYYRSLLQNGKK